MTVKSFTDTIYDVGYGNDRLEFMVMDRAGNSSVIDNARVIDIRRGDEKKVSVLIEVIGRGGEKE